MSLTEKVLEVAGPEIRELASGLSEDFVAGLKDVLEGADPDTQAKVKELVKQGYEFKRDAMLAKTADEARQYAEAAETSARRLKTVLLAERLIAEEKAARAISAIFRKALDAFGMIAKTLLTTVVEAAVSGAISGLTGGEVDGSGLSDLFHL